MNVLTVNLVLSTLVFAIAARLYVTPRIGRMDPRAVLVPILLLHAMRHLGLMFLAPGATYPGLPVMFARPAAFGDLLTSLLALAALPAVLRRARSAKALVTVFNVVGTLDLVVAITTATVSGAPKYMGPAYWIPAFWVPMLLVTHYVTFQLLRRPWPVAGDESRRQEWAAQPPAFENR
ncbi:hypothetical protein AKJ09_10670 [Labilithrix luteola]|uniref:Uncharacterized protein n=1 Tax=Labilithrix luteola TaxID=1391654 RepID=A0A0K1QEB2_9BACT|nr:hypothetical protein [Labilithrix luteola]AKV04007.1 hypothetical protein AKJ09_10670 [Labilithrix luteola]